MMIRDIVFMLMGQLGQRLCVYDQIHNVLRTAPLLLLVMVIDMSFFGIVVCGGSKGG